MSTVESGTQPYWSDGDVTLHLGDCLAVLATMEDASVDAVVTDPPYGLEFMGKDWDAPWQDGINADAGFSSVGLSDGGERLPRPTFTGSTNPHCRNCGGRQRGRRDGTAIWKTCTCEKPDFPNVRAVEMRAFQEWCEIWATECLRVLKPGGHLLAFGGTRTWHRLSCAIEDAGFEIRDSVADLTGINGPGLLWLYGSGFPKSRESLKPSWEPIAVARKPLAGTVAQNVLEHGTGALNIDGCRLAGGKDVPASPRRAPQGPAYGDLGNDPGTGSGFDPNVGRWPPNVVLGETAAAELDRQSGILTSGANPTRRSSDVFSRDIYGDFKGQPECTPHRGADSGGASRFFPVFKYEAKAAAYERPRLKDGTAHPTVKPVDLMAWLVRLVTPPGGLVLDPFAGSGTTAEACIVEGFSCVLIEQDPKSAELIKTRLSKPIQPVMFGFDEAS